jgi:hypothetical protein
MEKRRRAAEDIVWCESHAIADEARVVHDIAEKEVSWVPNQ